MKKHSNLGRWICSTITTLGVAGVAGLCQAQPVVYNFATGVEGWSGNEPAALASSTTYSWNATGGSTGGGCLQIVTGNATNTEIDPWVTLPSTLNESQYISVSVEMKVDPSSGTVLNVVPPQSGNLQAVFRNASQSWDSIWYGPLYSADDDSWVTYTFVLAPPYQPAEKYLQFQLQGSAGYTAPITVYIDNVTINPLPDPWVVDAFTQTKLQGGVGTVDTTEDAPFKNPINGTTTNFTPAGSWKLSISDPGGYNGWNQYQPLSGTMDTTRFQYFGFDIFLDGSSGSTYGGVQVLFFQNGWSGNQLYIGGLSFNSSMVGKWTHFDFPCGPLGQTASPALVFQGTPGSDKGTDTTTFHVDNLEFWTPQITPKINAFKPAGPGGALMTVDADGTNNQYDQEGISSPVTNNTGTDFFWIGQTPASYSFTLTNFPSPASAPGFEAHVYIVNGDTIGGAGYTYNQTYSGVPYNVNDYAAMRIQNGTNGGVQAIFEWKTNAPNANVSATNGAINAFPLPNYVTVNGTWTLSFSDAYDGTITGPNGLVGSFTLPNFGTDPNYTANFSPGDSMVQFGVAKNDGNNTGVNNNKSTVFTQVQVSNATDGTIYNENFSGPGLDANYKWQVAEYYLDASTRVIWQPYGAAYMVGWNTAAAGWTLQSTTNLLSGWSNAGVTYSYIDNTGTNTLGAVPATAIPAGNDLFFRLSK